jgi:adenylate cyclase
MTGPDPGVSDLERAILGEAPTLDAAQVAELAGVDSELSRRLWRALGFPAHAGEMAFTRADADALALVEDVVAEGALDLDTVVSLTRGVGQTMARLADWEVGTLVHRVEEIEAGEDAQGSRRAAARLLVDRVNTPFEQLLVYAWRRHLAAAVARVEALGDHTEDLHTVDVTVGFADIVSFTALANRLDDVGIGDLVEVFESRCADIVAAHGGRVIKSIGDSVLFIHEDAVAAVDTAEGIIDSVGRDKRLPDVRLGLATGSIVTRMGDVFGRPVNLAARLTAVARKNRVIIDDATAALLPAEDYSARRMPARPIHGFGLVEPLTLRKSR